MLPFFTCIYTVVSQVALLPSYNSKATVSSLFSLSVLIYFNLIEVFEWIWVKRECVWKVELYVSTIIPTYDTAYILDIE